MNAIRSWNRFWFAPVSARPLGAFRIAFGAILLFHFLILTDHFDYWLTGVGLLQGSESAHLAGPLRPSILQYFQHPVFVRVWVTATAALAFLLMVGKWTRVVSVLFYFFLLNIHQRNLASIYGGDSLIICMTFCLMFTPCGAAYSLDARKRPELRGRDREPIVAPWGMRLFQLQISIVYFMTAFLKLAGKSWQDGSAIYYVLHNPELSRWFTWLADYPIAINILTFGTLLLELSLAFLLWVKPARMIVIFFGLLLHTGIMFTINVPVFGELCIASYVMFLAPDQLDLVLRILNPLKWRATANTPARGLAPAKRGVKQPIPA